MSKGSCIGGISLARCHHGDYCDTECILPRIGNSIKFLWSCTKNAFSRQKIKKGKHTFSFSLGKASMTECLRQSVIIEVRVPSKSWCFFERMSSNDAFMNSLTKGDVYAFTNLWYN
jgi:hypothetical protein